MKKRQWMAPIKTSRQSFSNIKWFFVPIKDDGLNSSTKIFSFSENKT